MNLTIQEILPYIVFAIAGMVAAAINSVAGGGTLVSFPVLLAFGIPAVPANATNAVASWTGTLASVWSYRTEARGSFKTIAALTVPAILGALLGAWILVHTPESLFRRVVPGLILIATLAFWLQPKFKHIVERVQKSGNRSWYKRLGAFLLQILISVYGGYFGAGMGIIMLAVLGFFVEGNIHKLNAIKTWLATIINVAASIFFITSNTILFLPGIALAIGQVIGGYWGARLAVRIDPNLVRHIIVAIGLILTVVFAIRL